MRLQRILIIVAVIIGLVSGPWILESASLSQPPIQWVDIPFILFGCIVGLPFVLGLQVLMGNLKMAYSYWRFFALSGLFLLATGLSAFITAIFTVGVQPHALLFLTMGIGICMATFICQFIFGGKWAHLTNPSNGALTDVPSFKR